MITALCCPPSLSRVLARVLLSLGARSPLVARPVAGAATVSLRDWLAPRSDVLKWDWYLNERARSRDCCLTIDDAVPDAAAALEQLLTRCQRLLPFEQPIERRVQRVLHAHRTLFDLTKPLVAADYDHALDTWRWLLRLDLGASPALQLAGLFHDVERLESEPEQRIEHLAPSYQDFKTAHARAGASRAASVLDSAGLPRALVTRTQWLIESHETPGDDEELAALNDADGLSFFSLNAWGFAEYFGLEHTRRKVTYTLNRMRPRARRYLARFRHHPRIGALLGEELGVILPPAALASAGGIP